MVDTNFDLVDPAELTGYVRSVPQGDLRLNKILPDRRVDDIEYRFVRGSLVDVDAATFRSYDTESPIAKRQGTTRVTGELPPISRKVPLGEEALLRLRAAQSGDTGRILSEIYADAARMARAVAVRLELARGEVLNTGKLILNENGLSATVDFGRAAGHDVTAAILWTNDATAVPLTDLRAWAQTYRDANGVDPGAILMSDTSVANLMKCASVRNLVANVVNVTPNLATEPQVGQVLAAFGLPPIVQLNEKFRVGGVLTRVLPANRVIFVPPAGQPLGHTLYGITAEAMGLVESGRISLEQAPGIVAMVEHTSDPVTTWTKASGIALPVLANPDLTFAATV